jgi:hypothetical protein
MCVSHVARRSTSDGVRPRFEDIGKRGGGRRRGHDHAGCSDGAPARTFRLPPCRRTHEANGEQHQPLLRDSHSRPSISPFVLTSRDPRTRRGFLVQSPYGARTELTVTIRARMWDGSGAASLPLELHGVDDVRVGPGHEQRLAAFVELGMRRDAVPQIAARPPRDTSATRLAKRARPVDPRGVMRECVNA